MPTPAASYPMVSRCGSYRNSVSAALLRRRRCPIQTRPSCWSVCRRSLVRGRALTRLPAECRAASGRHLLRTVASQTAVGQQPVPRRPQGSGVASRMKHLCDNPCRAGLTDTTLGTIALGLARFPQRVSGSGTGTSVGDGGASGSLGSSICRASCRGADSAAAAFRLRLPPGRANGAVTRASEGELRPGRGRRLPGAPLFSGRGGHRPHSRRRARRRQRRALPWTSRAQCR
jgi:hypothetical protein